MSEQNNGQGRQEQRTRAFNPNDHVIQLKSRDGFRDYLPVQWRLVWFREQCPNGSMETEMLHLDLDRETEEEIDVWNEEKQVNEKSARHANGFLFSALLLKTAKVALAWVQNQRKRRAFLIL